MVDSGARGAVAVFSGGGTGGHLYPALALADALSRLRPDIRLLFLGASRGVEARILPERGLEHRLLPVRGFRRGRVLENVGVLWALLRSLLITGEIFSRVRPGLVVVTGGYAAGPAGLMAGIMGIPLALQEQNAQPGFTSRVLSRWARQIHLAFPDARDHLPASARARARLSGNPVRVAVQVDRDQAGARFGIAPGSRTVLVVGGSQGATAVNEAVLDMVRLIEAGEAGKPDDMVLLWATGSMNLAHIEGELKALGSPGWIRVLGYISEMPDALSCATMAVSRAGAMATSEFLAWGVPAVLIPLPTAAADHQSRNAESLARAGAALHMSEASLDGATLLEAVNAALADPDALADMRNAALAASRPEASREIAEALVGLLSGDVDGVRGGAT